MTSDDVVASLTRWSKQSIYGKDLFAYVTELRAVDKYTVEMKLKEKSIVLINLAVANNFAAIYLKEIAEKFPPQEKATEFIGTGPFKLVEWKPDQHIRMVRFDDYKPRSEKRNGYGGAKVAYIDEIDWMPVPDVATRVAQMETGELQLADDLIADLRPAEEQRQRAPDRLQDVLLARRGPQQEGGPDDEPEAPPGLAGGARHRADHEDGRRSARSSTGWTTT